MPDPDSLLIQLPPWDESTPPQPWVDALALDEPWALRQWNICVQDSHTLPPPVKLLLKHLTDGKVTAKPAG